MEYNNKFIELAKKEGGIDKETLETIAVLLSPFAPHFAEEMWEQLGHAETVFKAGWPTYDENEMKDDEIQIPVQINGKTRAVIGIPAEASKDEAIAAGKEAIADKADRKCDQRDLCSEENYKYCYEIIDQNGQCGQSDEFSVCAARY